MFFNFRLILLDRITFSDEIGIMLNIGSFNPQSFSEIIKKLNIF